MADLWWVDSGWKVGVDKEVPTHESEAMDIGLAANETEAAQLVVTPRQPLRRFRAIAGDLSDGRGHTLPSSAVEILRVEYVQVAQTTDSSSQPGLWPDPLPPMGAPLDLPADINQPLWLRVTAPRDAAAGVYTGRVELAAEGWTAAVQLRVEVFGFTLPARLTCQTALGFSPGTVFRYHGLKTEADRRSVLARYWDSFARHHISPYDPAPLDPIRVKWPAVQPPASKWADWENARIVTNETASGIGALLLFDDRTNANNTVSFRRELPVKPGGLRLAFRYRTALPGSEAMVSLKHYDDAGRWMSGANRDIVLTGSGRWDHFEQTLTDFPPGAATTRLTLWATRWSESGERTGLTWFDDVSVRVASGGEELATGGDFEPPEFGDTGIPDGQLQVRFDFSAWDRAMVEAIDTRHVNTFRLHVDGLGGGTYAEHDAPGLRGFPEGSREFDALLGSYLAGLESHLRERGWLDEAFVYWFDEPDPHQYPFVLRGFEKLKRHAPGLRRMLTEQPEPALFGGPNLWCPVMDAYRDDQASGRRKAGESFWWYICCSPKAPYPGEFIDRPGTELRAWLWQTFQRGIEGILIWETTYWTSPAAYPDPARPQNPYTDPMSWTSGYGTPSGARRPWGNGDGRFLYPPRAAAEGRPAAPVLEGPVDSIRWETLRDGLEDYEYLALLRRLLAAHPERAVALGPLLEVPADITAEARVFTRDPAPLMARRRALAAALTDLTSQ